MWRGRSLLYKMINLVDMFCKVRSLECHSSCIAVSAFGEHNDNSTATAVYSPTPCLKIRNMFDKEL